MRCVYKQASCEHPLVSVHMITYNHERFIAQAIESVLMQQADFPVELVVGEDCSTDGTRHLVEEYARRHPNVIRALLAKHNLGMQENSAAVSAACRGKYIAYLEGDDYWVYANKISEQVDILESNPRYSMCGSASLAVEQDQSNTVSGVYTIAPTTAKEAYGLLDFLREYPMHTSTILLRRGFVVLPDWLKVAFNRDICVFALHAEKGPVGYLDKVTAHYRLHQGGIWIGQSMLNRIGRQQQTIDLLDAHFGGKYRLELRRREYSDIVATTRQLVDRGMGQDARAIHKSCVSRCAKAFPFRTIGWSMGVWGGYRIARMWKRLRCLLALRARIKALGRICRPTGNAGASKAI